MATLTSKIKTVNLEFLVRNAHGSYNLKVEIVGHEIIFRALSCRTECYKEQAKLSPQRIANCIFALDPRIFVSEVEQVIRQIMLELN